MTTAPTPAQGIRANRAQFALLLLLVVAMALVEGAERSVLPVLGREAFGVGTTTATLSFIVAFGVAKALADFAAGDLAVRLTRRRVLVLGWVAAAPVAPMILWAPVWGWVVAANALLGIASAFVFSSSDVMRLDLAGPRRRGLALGLTGLAPIALGITALAAGWLAERFSPRPAPFLIALVASLAALVLVFRVRDTGALAAAEEDGVNGRSPADGARADRQGAGGEASSSETGDEAALPSVPDGTLAGLRWASWTHPKLRLTNQAGVAVNAADGVVWGIFPLFLAAEGLTLAEIGLIAGLYPMVVGVVEVAAGPLSDRLGRRVPIGGGMALMGAALAAFAMVDGLWAWLACAGAMGVGYAAAFPAMSAQVGDLVSARTRPEALGVYRMWRDAGHAVGALAAGLLADALGMRWAMGVVAGLVVVSGAVAALGLSPGGTALAATGERP